MNLEIFKNEQFGEVRTINENGKIMFCGSDVAKALGYIDTAKAIKQHCREDGWANYPVIDNLGRTQQAKFINEGNLYRLIASSKLESAQKFESWVFDEVLPSIRQTGGYRIPKTPMEALNLMFEVEKENAEKIEKLDYRMLEIEENAPLNPGEYNLISRKVSERIRNIKREYGLEKVTHEQNSALFKALNKDILEITGIRTRSQLRQKHLDMVLDFIRDWEPSKATMVIVNQLSLEF